MYTATCSRCAHAVSAACSSCSQRSFPYALPLPACVPQVPVCRGLRAQLQGTCWAWLPWLVNVRSVQSALARLVFVRTRWCDISEVCRLDGQNSDGVSAAGDANAGGAVAHAAQCMQCMQVGIWAYVFVPP